IFYLGLRYIRKNAQITLFDDYLVLKTDTKPQTIYFNDILKYKYSLGRNTNLTLYYSYYDYTTIRSNDMFCSNEELEEFCTDFENQIEKMSKDSTSEINKDKNIDSLKVQDSITASNSIVSEHSKFDKKEDVKEEQISNNI